MSPKARDLVIARIHHQETAITPYTLGFEGDVAERLDEYYGSARWRELLDPAIRWVTGADLSVDTEGLPLPPMSTAASGGWIGALSIWRSRS